MTARINANIGHCILVAAEFSSNISFSKVAFAPGATSSMISPAAFVVAFPSGFVDFNISTISSSVSSLILAVAVINLSLVTLATVSLTKPAWSAVCAIWSCFWSTSCSLSSCVLDACASSIGSLSFCLTYSSFIFLVVTSTCAAFVVLAAWIGSVWSLGPWCLLPVCLFSTFEISLCATRMFSSKWLGVLLVGDGVEKLPA